MTNLLLAAIAFFLVWNSHLILGFIKTVFLPSTGFYFLLKTLFSLGYQHPVHKWAGPYSYYEHHYGPFIIHLDGDTHVHLNNENLDFNPFEKLVAKKIVNRLNTQNTRQRTKDKKEQLKSFIRAQN